MLSASLRRFQTELCAREVLQLVRIRDKQPVKFTRSGVGDVPSTSQPGLKRHRPLGTPRGSCSSKGTLLKAPSLLSGSEVDDFWNKLFW